jgi:hypothetical protein
LTNVRFSSLVVPRGQQKIVTTATQLVSVTRIDPSCMRSAKYARSTTL